MYKIMFALAMLGSTASIASATQGVPVLPPCNAATLTQMKQAYDREHNPAKAQLLAHRFLSEAIKCNTASVPANLKTFELAVFNREAKERQQRHRSWK